MRPEFGCRIHDHVFNTATAATAGQIAYDVRQALERWEPRIEVLDVVVSFDAMESGVLYVDISYQVRGLNDPRNLVFPFYVIPSREEPLPTAATRCLRIDPADLCSVEVLGHAARTQPRRPTFQDLVDDAKRLVQQRCPTWTDHNVSDPGVTLIEAVAQMIDQLIYRLNRVPDLNYIKFLELIGVQLRPPAAAPRQGDVLAVGTAAADSAGPGREPGRHSRVPTSPIPSSSAPPANSRSFRASSPMPRPSPTSRRPSTPPEPWPGWIPMPSAQTPCRRRPAGRPVRGGAVLRGAAAA